MSRHPEAQELALFISRDLSAWRNFIVGRHVSGCANCRRDVSMLAHASSAFASEVDLIPGGTAGWERLAADMRANIRLGLEAGECVGDAPGFAEGELADESPRPKGWYAGWNPSRLGEWLHLDSSRFRLAPAALALSLVVGGAWWWQSGGSDPLRAYFSGDPAPAEASIQEPDGDVVFRTAVDGLVVERGSGRSLTLAHTGRAATALTVSLNGSMTARYVDDDDGQVTIHHVYAE
jgi:hypothetical protein